MQTLLSYTEIRAPVSGRIGSIASKAGAVVRVGDNTATSTLATINQIDPIYVSFAIPQVILPDLRAAMASGPVKVTAIVDDQKKRSGVMAFIENNVDPNTGTVTAKARIDNANELLWPGQFVKVEITLGVEPEAISVPAAAVQLGPQGAYVYLVKDGVAELRNVDVKRTQGGESVIGKGLAGGESVVIDGQLRLANGANVSIKSGANDPATATAPRGARRQKRSRTGDVISALHSPSGHDHPADGDFRHRRWLRLQAASRRRRPACRLPDHPGLRPAPRRQPGDHGRLGRPRFWNVNSRPLPA